MIRVSVSGKNQRQAKKREKERKRFLNSNREREIFTPNETTQESSTLWTWWLISIHQERYLYLFLLDFFLPLKVCLSVSKIDCQSLTFLMSVGLKDWQSLNQKLNPTDMREEATFALSFFLPVDLGNAFFLYFPFFLFFSHSSHSFAISFILICLVGNFLSFTPHGPLFLSVLRDSHEKNRIRRRGNVYITKPFPWIVLDWEREWMNEPLSFVSFSC